MNDPLDPLAASDHGVLERPYSVVMLFYGACVLIAWLLRWWAYGDWGRDRVAGDTGA